MSDEETEIKYIGQEDVIKLVMQKDYEIYKLQQKIDKAIEHLHKRYEQNNSALTNKEETIISKHELLKLENINNKILEDILKGEDNESN